MSENEAPPVEAEPQVLREIADHLKSIRSMLTFFTILAVVAIVIQGCNILMSF